jgi:hypothetical protein
MLLVLLSSIHHQLYLPPFLHPTTFIPTQTLLRITQLLLLLYLYYSNPTSTRSPTTLNLFLGEIFLVVLIAIFIILTLIPSTSTFYQQNRLKYQRELVIQIQSYILPPHLERVSDEEWGDSMLRYYSGVAHFLTSGILVLILLSEGLWLHASFALVDIIRVLLARYLIQKDQASVPNILLNTKLAMSAVFVSQLIVWTTWPVEISMLERGLLNRITNVWCFYELGEDIIIAMSITTLTACLASPSHEWYRFLIMYVKHLILLLIVVLLGIRGRLAKRLNNFSRRILPIKIVSALVISLLPVFAITTGFANFGRIQRAPLWRTQCITVFVMITLIFLSRSRRVSEYFDDVKMPRKLFIHHDDVANKERDFMTRIGSSFMIHLGFVLTVMVVGIGNGFLSSNVLAVLVVDPIDDLNNNTTNPTFYYYYYYLILIIVVTLLLLLLWITTKAFYYFDSYGSNNNNNNPSSNQQFITRLIFFTLHGLIVILYWQNNFIIVGLTTIRTLCGVVEHRESFSLFVTEHVMMSILSICAVGNSTTLGMVFLLTLTTLLFGLITTSARAIVAVIVEINQESQNMVEHALKQRFVATLSVVDEVLDERNNNNTSHSSQQQQQQKELITLLRLVKQQCQQGHDLTFMFTMIRRHARTGMFGGTISSQSLSRMIHEYWMERFDLSKVEWYCAEINEMKGLLFTLNFDLLRLILFTIIGRRKWHITYGFNISSQELIFTLKQQQKSSRTTTTTNNNNNWLLLTSGKKSSTTTSTTTSNGLVLVNWCSILQSDDDLYQLCHAIGATIHVTPSTSFLGESNNNNDGNNVVVVTLRVRVLNWSRVMNTNTTTTTTTTIVANNNSSNSMTTTTMITSIPPNLIIAILDDTYLVRIMLLRLLSQHFNISPDSFSKGSTYEEVDEFLEQCITKHADVVIIDLNLELKRSNNNNEIIMMYGSQVAKKLREKYFQGAIILSSAHDENIIESHHLEMIDGYLEKKIWRTGYVKEVIVKAINGRKKR